MADTFCDSVIILSSVSRLAVPVLPKGWFNSIIAYGQTILLFTFSLQNHSPVCASVNMSGATHNNYIERRAQKLEAKIEDQMKCLLYSLYFSSFRVHHNVTIYISSRFGSILLELYSFINVVFTGFALAHRKSLSPRGTMNYSFILVLSVFHLQLRIMSFLVCCILALNILYFNSSFKSFFSE